ncbi:MAG: DUF58 domain-containing protein, partial [Acidimicrobiales bacterium]
MRLTPHGRSLVVAAAVLILVGWLADYSRLIGLGGALLGAVAIAVAIVARPSRLEATRRVVPARVVVGVEATSELTVTNTAPTRSSAGTVRERIGDREVAVELPALDPGETTVVHRTLPTERRGVFTVGPLSIRRRDPLGLVLRGASEHDVATLIVHPSIHHVNPFPSGIQRDLDGSPSGEASEGGIAFSGLREYVPGDDLRLIHWRSSARIGELMVRHNVDNQQPRTAVILDTRARLHDEESFEEAIRVAASVVVAAIERGFPFTVRTTCGRFVDDRVGRNVVLDMFSELQASPGATIDLGDAGRLAAHDPTGLSLACVTGHAGVDDLRGLG